MMTFILPILLVAWLEANWSGWLDFIDVSLPLTLLVILYLRYQLWVGLSETILLAGVGGYLLDVLASPRSGLVMFAMVSACGLSGWLLGRELKRWQRWASLAVGLVTYQVIMSFGLGWSTVATAGLQLVSFIAMGLGLFAVMRFIGRRVEGWL